MDDAAATGRGAREHGTHPRSGDAVGTSERSSRRYRTGRRWTNTPISPRPAARADSQDPQRVSTIAGRDRPTASTLVPRPRSKKKSAHRVTDLQPRGVFMFPSSVAVSIDVEATYERYGPMVLRRCRTLLRDEERAVGRHARTRFVRFAAASRAGSTTEGFRRCSIEWRPTCASTCFGPKKRRPETSGRCAPDGRSPALDENRGSDVGAAAPGPGLCRGEAVDPYYSRFFISSTA